MDCERSVQSMVKKECAPSRGHPYAFVLKEGKTIDRNSLDYSLLLLQVGKPEVIRKGKRSATFFFHRLLSN